MKIHLVSFADGRFSSRRSSFESEAAEMSIFDSISVFSFNELDEEYQKRHGKFILGNARGFGYWIWKPQVLLQSWGVFGDGDIVVYMDVGFELNPSGSDRFKEYIELVKSHESKLLSFSNTHTEYRWNKADLVHRLGLTLSSPEMLTTQLAAGFFIMERNGGNLDLLQAWSEIAVSDNYHFSDDSESFLVNHPKFIEHRHDASIFSLLRKLSGTEVTHYEVQEYPQFRQFKNELPAWASRRVD